MARHKETPLEICTRAMLLGNSISVRMLEYLSTVKNLAPGFQEMATDFLDLSRVMWSIEAGLTEAGKTGHKLPVDMAQDLESKIRKTADDFTVLNQMVMKFLEYESKGTFGRLQKGWRLMFSSDDIEKMRHSLLKDREGLKMSSMVFRWTVGEAKADSSAGIGYTGLVAALERLNNTKPMPAIPPISPPPKTERSYDMDSAPQLPPVPLSSMSEKGASHLPRYDSFMPPRVEDRQNGGGSLHRHNSIMSTTPTTRSGGNRQEMNYRDTFSTEQSDVRTMTESGYRSQSSHHRDSMAPLPLSPANGYNYPTKFLRLQADPKAVPHWTPRPGPGVTLPNAHPALHQAIQNKDRGMVEKLLDAGAGTNDPSFLTRACLNSDEEIVRLLLLFGADANAVDSTGLTPLLAAIKTALVEGLEQLLKYGADPNLCGGADGESPLAAAVKERNLELVHMLLMYGADASAIMDCGSTTLVKIIDRTVQAKYVDLMLDYEADANAKTRDGTTALFAAIQAKRVDLMSSLLEHGANPNLPGPKHPLWPSTYHPEALQLLLSKGADTKKSPGIMELASSLKNIDSISILLDHGVSPNIKKDGIYTPLCSAIRDNSADIVTLLLANGADPNLPASEYPAFKCVTHNRVHFLPQLLAAGSNLNDPKGILETAVAHNNMEALKWLMGQGVSLNDRSEEGRTALTTAIKDNRTELVDLLLSKGANPNVRGEDWPILMAVKRPEILKKILANMKNPSSVHGSIEAAVQANQLESMKMLLKAGVSVEDKTGGVFSPLTTALREQRKDLVRFLLFDAGADPNVPGEHLPIIKSIRRCPRGDTEMIEMLLDCGADVNKMYRGWNAILQAVESGNMKILKVLIEKGNGVDLNVTDDDGKTVAELVKERGWSEALPLLFPNGASSKAAAKADPALLDDGGSGIINLDELCIITKTKTGKMTMSKPNYALFPSPPASPAASPST